MNWIVRVILVNFLLWAFVYIVKGENINYDKLADAIGKAENSKSHPYGILQHYKHTTPRQACINTIKHAQKDWNGKGDFVEFLGSRYCPIGCKNDNGTNKFWVKNVKHFLRIENAIRGKD
jgi:hypothetical protein